jgi:hypothetical protein
MSGEAGPSTGPPQDVNQLARQISGLNDASLMALGELLPLSTRKRLQEALAPSDRTPDRKGKRPALFSKPAVKTLRDLYILLRAMHYEHHIAWIQDLRGFCLVMSEEKGNVSTCKDSNDPYKCWLHPADDQASTVMCLCPKRGSGQEYEKLKIRKPSTAKPKAAGMKTEGYVYYQIPTWVKETCVQKGIEPPFAKMVVHRLVLLAHLVLADTPVDQVPTDMECSHLCGNPWCWLHLDLETASVNQSRGPCFDPANEIKFPCNSHGTDPPLYCVRSRAASSLIPGLLVDGKDHRREVELSTARRWWDERDLPSGTNAIEYYIRVRKVGGKGPTGLQKAGELLRSAFVGSPLVTLLRPSGRRGNGDDTTSGSSL